MNLDEITLSTFSHTLIHMGFKPIPHFTSLLTCVLSVYDQI